MVYTMDGHYLFCRGMEFRFLDSRPDFGVSPETTISLRSAA